MTVRRHFLSAGILAVTTVAALLLTTTAANADTTTEEPFTINPGEQVCVTATVDHYPDDGLQENVDMHGISSVPVRYVIYQDVIDGTDGFENATLYSQTYPDRLEWYNQEQLDPGDVQSSSEQFWFCADNRSESIAEGTLQIATSNPPAQGYVVKRTGNSSYHVYGKLLPGQEACVGGGGRSAFMDSFIGLRRAEITMRNSKTTLRWITYEGLYTRIDSAFLPYPDGLMGCVKNTDSAPMNFIYDFGY